MRTTLRVGRGGSERGAVLILVAVFMVVAVVMLAAVVDLGGLRQEKKELTLSTDAAALAAVPLVAWGDSTLAATNVSASCATVPVDTTVEGAAAYDFVEDVVVEYLAKNGTPVEDLPRCEVVRTGDRQGYVLVQAQEDVEFQVATAFGQAGSSVSGSTVAASDFFRGGGLRPIGICGLMTTLAYSDYPVISLSALASGGSGGYGLDGQGYVVDSEGQRTAVTIRLPIEHTKGTDCGGDANGSGNFGKLNFGDGTRTECEVPGYFCTDLRDGYWESVENPVSGDTGNNWSANEIVDRLDLVQSLDKFLAPIFTSASEGGSNAEFVVTHYAQMRMVAHCVKNCEKYAESTASPSTASTYFDVEVDRVLPFVNGAPAPFTDDARELPPRICSVSADPSAIAAGCPSANATLPSAGDPCVLGDTLSVTPAARKHSSKNELQQSVQFSVPVSNESDCSSMSMTIKRGPATNAVDSCCVVSGASAAGGEGKDPPAGWTWSTGPHELVVTAGSVSKTYPFTVS